MTEVQHILAIFELVIVASIIVAMAVAPGHTINTKWLYAWPINSVALAVVVLAS